jgi:hypothetical protein
MPQGRSCIWLDSSRRLHRLLGIATLKRQRAHFCRSLPQRRGNASQLVAAQAA